MAIGTGTGLAIAGGLGLAGSIFGGNAQKDAANAAAQAAAFREFDITGPSGSAGFGATPEQQAQIDQITAQINEQFAGSSGVFGELLKQKALQKALSEQGLTGLDNNINVNLSPELQGVRDQLLGTGQGFLSALQDYNPDEAALNLTNRLRAIAEPKERRDRQALENTLHRRGLLSATGGDTAMESLFTAQNLADEQRQARSFTAAQGVQDSLMNRALSGISGATTMDQLPLGLLDRSLSAGGAQALAGANQGRFQFLAGQNQADTISSMFNTAGSTIADLTMFNNARNAGINADLESQVFNNPGLF